jgi:hypothetical protein
MKYIIIEVNNLLIKADAEKLKEDVFTIETPDYMIELTNDNGELHVSNAIDGYGYNKRSDFMSKEVTLYYQD